MRRHGVRGFTLIEVLIGLGLSVGLLSFFASMLASLQHNTAITADQAGVGERASLLLDLMSDYAAAGYPVPAALASGANPCVSPAGSASNRAGMLLAHRDAVPCFPASDMPEGAPLLMFDVLTPCDPLCSKPGEPGFLYLDPGCHPVFAITAPEVRRVARRERPADCGLGTQVAVLERRLMYFRSYAWRAGDGLGAIMVKRLKPESPVRWSQADMLIAGVTDWQVTPQFAASRCPVPALCAATGIADGVEVTVTTRGWVRDAAAMASAAAGFATTALSRVMPGATVVMP